MKSIKQMASILLVAASMLLVSCDMDEILHDSMLNKTKWECVKQGEFEGDDGNIHNGVRNLLFHFKKASEGTLTITTTTSAGTQEKSASFEYTFMEISGTITIKEGEYSGEYKIAYSHCDETLILYNSANGVSMVLYKVTE